MVDKLYNLFGQCFFYKKSNRIVSETSNFSNREKILKEIINMPNNADQIEQLRLFVTTEELIEIDSQTYFSISRARPPAKQNLQNFNYAITEVTELQSAKC